MSTQKMLIGRDSLKGMTVTRGVLPYCTAPGGAPQRSFSPLPHKAIAATNVWYLCPSAQPLGDIPVRPLVYIQTGTNPVLGHLIKGNKTVAVNNCGTSFKLTVRQYYEMLITLCGRDSHVYIFVYMTGLVLMLKLSKFDVLHLLSLASYLWQAALLSYQVRFYALRYKINNQKIFIRRIFIRFIRYNVKGENINKNRRNVMNVMTSVQFVSDVYIMLIPLRQR